jgi:hypothetical protein
VLHQFVQLTLRHAVILARTTDRREIT